MSLYGDGVHHRSAENDGFASRQDLSSAQYDEMLADLSADLLPMDFEMQPFDPAQTPFSDHTGITADPADLFAHGDPHDQSSTAAAAAAGGVGAGPLPTGFGVQPAPNAGSTLTEFTKRRNWSQRVLDELKDFLFILTADGRFLYASPSCKALTGYEPSELVGRIIVELIHPDDASIFVREFHESIASGNALRFFYRFRKADSKYAIFESHGHPHLTGEAVSFGAQNSASFCRGFFMMARPYPTKNAALLDSFLEHKIENERLRKRVAELKQEEKDDNDASQMHWQKRVDNGNSVSGTNESVPARLDRASTSGTSAPFATSAAASTAGADYNSMPPPAKPGISNTALTRQNLNEALAASKPDSINDKMARYEGATHIETIEMLTGLRYRDGERSKGISTGERSPALIRGDAGIAILVDKDGRPTTGTRAYSSTLDGNGDKKKKAKVADEYVCTDCGTLDSPEWRKGPNGPKTLCNACGLRWAKKEKKRQGGSSITGSTDNTASPIGKPAPSSSSTPQHPPSQGTQSSPLGPAGSNMASGPSPSHPGMSM